ncbi:MAG: hypothetical protein CMH57_01425 [Myxococcales bacterium]|nr:hypothetical protein [Myxococcales bacterium]
MVDPAIFERMIVALLYPTEVPVSEVESWADGGELRIGAMLDDPGGTSYKLFRQIDPSSTVLQDVTDGRNTLLARGAADVVSEMASRLGMPDWREYSLVHAWDFSIDPEAVAQPSGALPSDPEARRLVELYRSTLAIEAADLKLQNARGESNDLKRELDEVSGSMGDSKHLHAELESLAWVKEITDADKALVEENTEREARFKSQLEQARDELDEARLAFEDIRPVELKRDLLIWGTAGVALVIYVVSFAFSMEKLALVNLLVLGGTTSGVLRRFSLLEQSESSEGRVSQLERRVESLESDQDKHRKSYRELMARASVNSPREFWLDVEAYDEITEKLAEIERKSEASGNRERIAELKRRIDAHEDTIEALMREREELGEYGLPSYEIERSLQDMGFDPAGFRPAPKLKLREPTGTAIDVAPLLANVAEQRGLMRGASPSSRLTAAWNKLAVHLAGTSWEGISLDDEGYILPPAPLRDGFEGWAMERPDVARLLVSALAAAIFASSGDRAGFFCLLDPYAGLDENRQRRLERTFESLSSRANIVIIG